MSTFTSVTIVDSPVTGGGIGAPDSSQTAGGPSLQNGAAGRVRGAGREVVAVVAAAVVWAVVV